MFSRWMFVKLKSAENALYNGRIDEAYERLHQAEVSGQRKTRKLLDQLAKALLARARVRAQSGAYREALDDLDKLDAIARGGADTEALRRRVSEQMRHRVGRDVDRREAYARAAGDLQAGRLESGRAAIEQIDDERQREQLRNELDIRVQRSEQMLEQVRAALKSGDVSAACRVWQDACRRHGRTRRGDELAPKLVAEYRKQMDRWFDAGQLDRFAAALPLARTLREFDPSLEEYERLAKLFHRAGELLAESNHNALREILLRVRAARSGPGWLKNALSCVGSLAEAQERLLSSPLALLGPSVGKTREFVTDTKRAGGDTVTHDADDGDSLQAAAPLTGRPLLVLVDGTGSSLLVARDVVRIGRAGGDMRKIEAPIPADIQSHHADIVRDGEDYFLVAYGPARVNRRSVKRTLLRDGDRIVLGDSAKMVFRKPSVKSGSAVLVLSDRCRLPQDVSHVVLLSDTCLLGPQSSCHVRTREGQTRLVLFDRKGRLFARQAVGDGRPAGRAEPAQLNQTRDFGDLTVTVKRYEQLETGGPAHVEA